MLHLFRSPSPTTTAGLILLICTLVAAPSATVRARSWLLTSSQSVQLPATLITPAMTTAAAEQAPDEPVEVELITLGLHGFEPSEITRPHGRFIMAINNHTGLSELSLHLDRLKGNRIHDVRMRQGRIKWNQSLDLPPGDYLLSEENHPDWVCHIKLIAN